MTPKEQKDLVDDVRTIKMAIIGDKTAGIEGLVKRTDRHEKQLSTLQKVGWGIGGATFLMSIIWAILIAIN